MIKKVFIIAGEASGDLWGAPIVKALIKKDIKIKGLGGDEMKSAGLKSIASIKPLSIMGIFEVIKNLASVYKIYKKTMVEIEKFKPDVVLTIDSPGFNFRIAKAVKKLNPKIKKIHFVAPQVWAWKEDRAKKIAKIFDHLLCLFPFEKKYFTPYGLKTSFVGHPVIESGVEKGNAEKFRKKYNLKNETVVSIIPGSRISEIERMLPVLLKTAKTLSLAFPQIRFFIPVVSATRQFIKNALQQFDLPIKTIDGNAENRYDLFSASKLAIALTMLFRFCLRKKNII
ncbi:MAG: lipid-A-disaccharide synthase [Rickettsiaceae bacterium 4572_127]|nr:MAG: lipid-A-disaccharide synthase [Rickettsiaceae bacterium 4572_127]